MHAAFPFYSLKCLFYFRQKHLSSLDKHNIYFNMSKVLVICKTLGIKNQWLLIRDCQSLHVCARFSDSHEFEKPNDVNALKLMNRCAEEVMKEFQDLILAYGQSDEYRSEEKITTCHHHHH